MGIACPRRHEHRERKQGGDEQDGERETVIVAQVEHRCHDKRSDRGAGLVHGFMQGKAPAASHAAGGKGKHGVPRGIAHRFADTLEKHEENGKLPVSRQG